MRSIGRGATIDGALAADRDRGTRDSTRPVCRTGRSPWTETVARSSTSLVRRACGCTRREFASPPPVVALLPIRRPAAAPRSSHRLLGPHEREMRLHEREESLRVERLTQVAEGVRAKCELSRCYVIMRRHEDDRRCSITAGGHYVAQIESTQASKLHVEHE